MGTEYTFASGSGIFNTSPKEAPGARFRESLELGTFEGGSSELRGAIDGMCVRTFVYVPVHVCIP